MKVTEIKRLFSLQVDHNILVFRAKILYVYPMKCSSMTTFLASSGCDDTMCGNIDSRTILSWFPSWKFLEEN